MSKSKFSIGPAALVAAAFIGPGTVTAATKAGANFGWALLWALLFSVIATIILQEMTARLGVVTQKDLGETIRQQCKSKWARFISVALIVGAILIGNSAYQGGNISGASLAVDAIFQEYQLFSELDFNPWAAIIGLIAFTFLMIGNYKVIEKLLISLVLLMGVAFITTGIMTKPDFSTLLQGTFVPSIPDGATLTIIALIGTTVVPYNLFLHSSSAKRKWTNPEDLSQARRDIYFSIPIGGIISMAIVSTAAVAYFGKQVTITSAGDLAYGLQPLFGESAKVFMAIGLFAAGLSSAITAPLATSYALQGILKLNPSMKSLSFRLIWMSILLIGVTVSSLGLKPISIIWFAQVANGILLPIVAIFLLWVMNNKSLGSYKNTVWQNILGGIVILVTLLLSGRSLFAAFGLL